MQDMRRASEHAARARRQKFVLLKYFLEKIFYIKILVDKNFLG
jgi:hypothetical protein